jgi:hypothetical protein
MVAGIRWTLETVVKAAEAEMNDDSALRDQLLEAEMRREMGEISDDEFAGIEADLLDRIREIKERREGSGPLALGASEPMESSPESRFQVEASIEGDFYDSPDPDDRPSRSKRTDRPDRSHSAAGTGRTTRTRRTTRTTRSKK